MPALRRVLLGCLLLLPSLAVLPSGAPASASDAGLEWLTDRYPSGGPEGLGDTVDFRLYDDDLSPSCRRCRCVSAPPPTRSACGC
jgi:hypothetical protein